MCRRFLHEQELQKLFSRSRRNILQVGLPYHRLSCRAIRQRELSDFPTDTIFQQAQLSCKISQVQLLTTVFQNKDSIPEVLHPKVDGLVHRLNFL